MSCSFFLFSILTHFLIPFISNCTSDTNCHFQVNQITDHPQRHVYSRHRRTAGITNMSSTSWGISISVQIFTPWLLVTIIFLYNKPPGGYIDIHISHTYTVSSTLAPAFFSLGSADATSQQSPQYQKVLKEAGVPYTVKEYEGGQHPFIHSPYPEKQLKSH